VSDGFSHARSLAFMVALVVVQGTVALVGLGQAFGGHAFGDFVERLMESLTGAALSDTIVATIDKAQETGAARQFLPLLLGLAGCVVTGTIAMAQLERALNRLYGVEQDRPFTEKYGRALVFACTVGVLVTLAFVAIAIGRDVGDALDNDLLSTTWTIVRLPLALLALVASMALLFRWCPRRRQPAFSWMAFGSTISVVGVFLVTAVLAGVLRLSSTFGDTYGPLAGMMAILLWAMFSSMALLFGASVAAQLEAVRAGAMRPQAPEKVAQSDPHATPKPSALAGTPS